MKLLFQCITPLRQCQNNTLLQLWCNRNHAQPYMRRSVSIANNDPGTSSAAHRIKRSSMYASNSAAAYGLDKVPLVTFVTPSFAAACKDKERPDENANTRNAQWKHNAECTEPPDVCCQLTSYCWSSWFWRTGESDLVLQNCPARPHSKGERVC